MHTITLKHYKYAIIITSSDREDYEFLAYFHNDPDLVGYGNTTFEAIENLLACAGLKDAAVLRNLGYGDFEIEIG